MYACVVDVLVCHVAVFLPTRPARPHPRTTNKLRRASLCVQVNIASINCQEFGSICSAKGVRGYPTLLLFKAGEAEPIKYQGARDVSSFVTFLEERV